MNKKAARLIELNLHPVLLGKSGDALKRPQLKGWQTANYTLDDLETWPARANVGVRCGKTRNGRYLYVFDFDYDAAAIFPQWQEKAAAIVGRELVTVSTGKGYHVYIVTRQPHTDRTLAARPVTDSAGKTREEVLIEIRGDRQQVVTPGSLHPSGRRYKLISNTKFDDIPQVTEDQYQALVNAAKAFDLRPVATVTARKTVDAATFHGVGELAGVANCLDYARRFIGGQTKTEPNGDIRFTGNGGLLIKADGSGWYCFSEQTGGGLPDLIAWHRHIGVGEALALLHPAPSDTFAPCHFELHDDPNGLTIELKEGQFLGDVQIDLPDHAYLTANTGTGKTTWAVTLPGKVLLVVPTVAILQQQAGRWPKAAVYYQDMKTVKGGEDLIITTPDSLPKVFQYINATEYTLVVDEAHNIAVAGYRQKAYDNVVRCLNGSWQKVILMTGTPLPLVTQNLSLFEVVKVRSPLRKQTAQRVVYQKGESLAACVARVPLNGRSLIFLQDKQKKLDRLVSLLYQKGFTPDQLALINADTREDAAYKTLVDHETVTDSTRVVISTSVIAEGFNIRTPFDTVHLLSGVSSVIAQQIVNRFRTAAAGVVYWYNRGEKKGKLFDVNKIALQVLQDSQALADSLNDCEAADLNEADIAMIEWQRSRALAASYLYTTQLVETEEDIETGHKYWQPSPTGVNHAVYRLLEHAECENPAIFKRHTAVYGWEWLPDCVAGETLDDTSKKQAAAFAEEKAEDRAAVINLVIDQIEAAGVDVLKHNIRAGTGERLYHALGVSILTYYDILGDFQTACNLARETGTSTRKINTMKRRLKIQLRRNEPVGGIIQNAIYMIFETGARLTPDQIKERLEAVYMSDPVLSLYATKQSRNAPEPLTNKKAVQILADHYNLKRCKIQENGAWVNAWELVDDVPEGLFFSQKSVCSKQNTKFCEKRQPVTADASIPF